MKYFMILRTLTTRIFIIYDMYCKKRSNIRQSNTVLLNFRFRPRAEYISFPSVWRGLTEYRLLMYEITF